VGRCPFIGLEGIFVVVVVVVVVLKLLLIRWEWDGVDVSETAIRVNISDNFTCRFPPYAN